MKKLNWTEIDAATYGDRLPAGGYILKITDIEDDPKRERLIVTYDIAEGDYKGKYSDTPESDVWMHQFSQHYSDKAKSFFKGFLQALADSNNNFNIADWEQTSDEKDLIGLNVGMIFRNYHYISERDGKRKVRTETARPIAASTIRKGDFTVPEDRYQDGLSEEVVDDAASAQSNLYDEGVPF